MAQDSTRAFLIRALRNTGLKLLANCNPRKREVSGQLIKSRASQSAIVWIVAKTT